MHLNTKKIAFAGVMLALTEVGIALGSVIETNTLFLLAAASFFVGIVIQEFGLKSGAGFLLAGILLAILLSPNKLYVVSYAFMGFYILIIELFFLKNNLISYYNNLKLIIKSIFVKNSVMRRRKDADKR